MNISPVYFSIQEYANITESIGYIYFRAQVTIRYLQDLLDLLKKLKKENEIKKE